MAFHADSRRSGVVLDPFVGSGTVILEAARRGWTAIGVEVNPAAFYLASFYRLATLTLQARAHAVARASAFLQPVLGSLGPLFDVSQSDDGDVSETLVSAWSAATTANVEAGVAEFLSALLVLVDLYDRPVTRARVQKVHSRLVRLASDLPTAQETSVEVCLGDARRTAVSGGSVDLVITSPPYINVYNYHQKYRASVEAMGWDVLVAARSEIGSNRKHRSNRVLTVVQYCLDMVDVLREVCRVLAPGGSAVFVVGRESMVRKTAFYNGEIIAELANGIGMDLSLRQERVFGNRFGQNIYEDILHLNASTNTQQDGQKALDCARDVASRVLRDASSSCPRESREDIEAALASLNEVQPSPLANSRRVAKHWSAQDEEHHSHAAHPAR